MKLRPLASLSLAIALGATTGAAVLPGATNAAPAARSGSCFWIRSVENFASVDNRTVYVRAAGRSVYELKLFAPCLDVDWSHHIAIRSRGGSSVCEGTGNFVEIFTHSTASHQRCSVTSVRKLSPDEITALPRGARP